MMDNPGIVSLGDATLGAADTGSIITTSTYDQGTSIAYVDGLAGALSATLQANFVPGTGGIKTTLYFQTSLDQGASWIDIWSPTFTTASGKKVVNVSALTPRTSNYVPTDGALADDTVIDGVLGDRLRVKKVSTGTYAGNASVATRACLR
jgi:hypothetical protein